MSPPHQQTAPRSPIHLELASRGGASSAMMLRPIGEPYKWDAQLMGKSVSSVQDLRRALGYGRDKNKKDLHITRIFKRFTKIFLSSFKCTNDETALQFYNLKYEEHRARIDEIVQAYMEFAGQIFWPDDGSLSNHHNLRLTRNSE